MADTGNAGAAGRVAFTHPNFVLFLLARACIIVATEMQTVAVGLQVYEITRKPLDLGLIGLAQFLPGILLFLISGHAADRFDRAKLLVTCFAGSAVCSGLLLWITVRGVHSVFPIYAVVVLLGVVRSFTGPATRAILPQLIPEEHFPNAVAWGATVMQTSVIVGPALGGVIYAAFHGPSAVYGGAAAASIAAMWFALRIRIEESARPREEISMETVLAGLRYIWRQKLVLGSISLDMFAVLLGGATILLPLYSLDILKTGEWGVGVLRSAQAIGATGMAVLLAHRPLQKKLGATLLWCVGGFGAFTVVFGVSRSLLLSMLALALVGASDMVSIIIRATFVQLGTPDEMRGRVNAVDMIFIGASNQLGGFESGLTAAWFGAVPAVVLGGVGAMVVAGLWAWIFPEVRKAEDVGALRS